MLQDQRKGVGWQVPFLEAPSWSSQALSGHSLVMGAGMWGAGSETQLPNLGLPRGCALTKGKPSQSGSDRLC